MNNKPKENEEVPAEETEETPTGNVTEVRPAPATASSKVNK